MSEHGQTPSPRIEELDRRVGSLEAHREREARSSVARFGRLGVIVGCLGGILGGSNTLLQWWRDYRAAPDIELQTARALDLGWSPAERKIDFKCVVSLRNNGTVRGVLQKPRATIRPCSGSAPALEVKDVRLAENQFEAPFPLKLGPDARRDVQFIVETGELPSFDQVFGAARAYRLEIELDPVAVRPAKATYSFSLGEGALTELTRRREYSQSGNDPRCPSSE